MWARFDFLFVFTLFFAGLDAWGIGANDVANSFATSVSSRSLTLRQALLAASVCEFAGAVTVGARVASTIRSGIISLSAFNNDAGLIMLAFTCVSFASCVWLTFATRMAMPVSTTHTVVGATIGAGIAVGGRNAVRWGWSGVSQIIASWFIAPAIAGGLAAVVFLLSKYLVLYRSNSAKIAVFISPLYFFAVTAILTTVIIAKGSPSLNLDEMSPGATAAAILGTATVVSLLSALFYMPYVYSQVIKKDSSLRWYHIFLGPLLWRRPVPADAGQHSVIRDYYEGHHDAPVVASSTDPEVNTDPVLSSKNSQEKDISEVDDVLPVHTSALAEVEGDLASQRTDTHDEFGRPWPPKYRQFDGEWLQPWNIYIVLRYNALPWAWYTISAGLRTDVHKQQTNTGTANERAALAKVHAHAEHYDNETEHAFSFLQVLTACTASFAHGANDVSNAIAPLAVVYGVWSTMEFPGRSASVPIWILVYGGALIVIGLATYGWRLMGVLGNKLTLHSPSRGFSIELGAAITVVLASYLALPVSTTQSVTGATLGVALASNGVKGMRSTNWRGFVWVFMSWVFTLPAAGLISGCTLAILLGVPKRGIDVGLPSI